VLALILRFLRSRAACEFLDDAARSISPKNPDALISALIKISDDPDVPHVPTEVQQCSSKNPPSGFDLGGLFATHPPIRQTHPSAAGARGVCRRRERMMRGGLAHALPPGMKSPWE